MWTDLWYPLENQWNITHDDILHLHVALTNRLFSILDYLKETTKNITIGTRACPYLMKLAWNSSSVMNGSYCPAASVCLHVAINRDWRRVLAVGVDLGQTGLMYTIQKLLGTITREREPQISWKPNTRTIKRRWTQRETKKKQRERETKRETKRCERKQMKQT